MDVQKDRVAIVIVNYNGLDYTRDCIGSVLKNNYGNFTVILVDNGSTDGSGKELKEYFGGRIVFLRNEKNLGVTGGNNAGISHAVSKKFDRVLFLNNDTVVEPDFLTKLMSAVKNDNRTLAVPKIVCFFDRTRLDHFIGKEFDWLTMHPAGYEYYPKEGPKHNIRRQIGVSSTCCLLIPACLISDIGKMDENYFMYYDDSDFTIQAARAGYGIVYEPSSVIYHKCNMTTKNKQPSYFEYYLQNRNVFYFYNKLCGNKRAKYLLFSKIFLNLIKDYIKAVIKQRPLQRAVIRRIISDVLAKRMGLPPDFTELR